MAFVTWNKDELGTGVAKYDEQHKEIFNLLNALHTATASGDRNAIGAKLDALINYVVKHFKDEEAAMQAKKYSGFAAHKGEHDKLVSTCADLQKKFHANKADVTADTTKLVKDWLYKHIPSMDRAYESCLNG